MFQNHQADIISRYFTLLETPGNDSEKKKPKMKCLTSTESWSGPIIPIFDPNLVVG